MSKDPKQYGMIKISDSFIMIILEWTLHNPLKLKKQSEVFDSKKINIITLFITQYQY